jgi:class 3 adenylate cyclase
VLLLRRSMRYEVAELIAYYQKLEIQKALIDSQIELNNQVFAFLPRIIAKRIRTQIDIERRSILEAIDEVLRPREKVVVALFSDIRQFTRKSKADGYLREHAMPNIKESTEIIERFGGVPRLVGDLVFAYFDDDDTRVNLQAALNAAVDLMRMNEQRNRAAGVTEAEVRRFPLISIGRAIVGNVGGSGSAREITALGSCINKLSRLDELTKLAHFASHFEDCIIMTREAGEVTRHLYPERNVQRWDLADIGLAIRDFPEDLEIYVIPLKQAREEEVS